MQNLQKSEVWFITGSQHLYGEQALKEVAENSKNIVSKLNEKKPGLPIVFKPVLTTSDEISKLCLEANNSPQCAGLVLWMHTFSPAKMWINGLNSLTKPFLHLHTQFNQDLPWSKIDMDFMNLNQAAHGDREAGFAHTRMRLRRKIVAGHWSDPGVFSQMNSWMGAAQAWQDMQGAKFVRFGDNMRQVAVTDGDKVSAEIKFGFSVNSHGIGDLVEYISKVGQGDIGELCSLYEDRYEIAKELKKGGSRHDSLREEAKTEIALRGFLKQGNFKGFTTNFEDIHGLKQLPGLAVQRLMADGYGFGAEGDWKTCTMVRALKVMGAHTPGGTSFMEDYTYHLNPTGPLVLGAHMLEVCETIASERPRLEIHPLGIGGKSDPVRLVFNAKAGPALNASLVDLGNRFRMVVNKVETITPPEPLPHLPVARAVWKCEPNFKTATSAWILAGGGHHTAYSNNVTSEQLEDFSEIAGIELVCIDSKTEMTTLKQNLRNNEVYYHLSSGIGR